MKAFIDIVLKMSVYGSIAILLVLILRSLFRKVPKKTVVLFWIVAAVRLVCPLNFGTPVSLLSLAPQGVKESLRTISVLDFEIEDPSETFNAYAPDVIKADISGAGNAVRTHGYSDSGAYEGTASYAAESTIDNLNNSYADNHTPSKESFATDPAIGSTDHAAEIFPTGDVTIDDHLSPAASATSGIPMSVPAEGNVSSMIAFFVWLIGAAVIILFVAISVIRTNRVISRLFKHSGSYMESDAIRTPFVIGLINPKICVPSQIDVSEKDYMLLHEHIHVKNHDALIKAFALFVLCLHWFNPLVWLAFRLCMSDLEMRCDEEVIDILGDRIRKEYCLSIVNHAAADDEFRVFTTAFAKKSVSKMEIKMRIKNLINYKKVSKLTAVSVLIVALTASFVLTSCAQTETPSGASSEVGAEQLPETADIVSAEEDPIVGIVSINGPDKEFTLTVKETGSNRKTVIIKDNKTGASKDFSIPVAPGKVYPASPLYKILEGTESRAYTDRASFERDLDNLGFPFNGENIDNTLFSDYGTFIYYEDASAGSSNQPPSFTVEGGMEGAPVDIKLEPDDRQFLTVETHDGTNVSYFYDEEHTLSGNLVVYNVADEEYSSISSLLIKLASNNEDNVMYEDGSQLVTRTNLGVTFDSFEEFKSFYSSENLEDITSGKYAQSDPRVSIVSRSEFGSREADAYTSYMQHGDCYIMQRIFPNGKTHFTLTYFPRYCSIVRLENIPAETEG